MDSAARQIELLAPARDAGIAIEAIRHGADAVYIGASSHGARLEASNPLSEIARVAEYAHRFNARVYVALNTIVYEQELRRVEKLARDLYHAGADALIVQDMALLRMDLPPIALHASTQCDIRDEKKARFLQEAGFSRLVLARELSFEEIARISRSVDIQIEAFVHGALCVSYSGDCHASCSLTGRSANRGECAQICRLPYDLVDGSGCRLVQGKHLLSLRDLNRIDDIQPMILAGVSSFKIEGRLKDARYVKNAVAAYRQAIDKVISDSSGRYCRSSAGSSSLGFVPSLAKGFNRGYTRYFADEASKNAPMASIDTPKHTGEKVGEATGVDQGRIRAKLSTQLHNGDGLGYFDRQGRFGGFRLNKIENGILYPASPLQIPFGTVLYRNRDKLWDDLLAGETAARDIEVDFTLRMAGDSLVVLEASDQRDNRIAATALCQRQKARTPQEQARRRVLEKTGDTIYRIRTINDLLGESFLPASLLAGLRRDALALLDKAQGARYLRRYRLQENRSAIYPFGEGLTYHDNLSNSLAEEFYRDHGIKTIEKALELTLERRKEASGTVIMTTRYCLRRELGRCLKTPKGKEWQGPLYLETSKNRLRLDFDCSNCQMKVIL